MLNVMLVDDNKSVLEGLGCLIDWEEYGYTVAASVRSGEDATKKVDEVDIDLVITDIRMPKMTGIELIEKLREKKQNLKFILISSYSEFDYAKWAVDNRIDGYLLKPIDEDELISKLVEIKNLILNEKDNKRMRRSRYLENILMGKSNDVDELNIINDLKTVRYCVARPYDSEFLISQDSNNYYNKADELCDIISAMSELDGCVAKNDLNETVFIFSDNNSSDSAIERILHIEKKIIESYNFNCELFISSKIDFDKINETQLSIEILKDCAFYEKYRKLFIQDEYKNKVFSEFLPNSQIIDSLIYSIKNDTDEKCMENVRAFLDDIRKSRVRKKSVIRYISNIFFDVCHTMSSKGIDSAKYLYRVSMLEKKIDIRFHQIVSFLEENALEINHSLKEMSMKQMSGMLGEIIDYIDTNYNDENLSLQYLSKKFHVNASHLGKMLKKKNGRSFNSYLMNIRIEKAKELLIKTDSKVYEIAYLVGFSSQNYFTNKFIEVENITPIKYREKFRKKEE